MKKSLAMMLALIMVCALPGIASANGKGSINGACITQNAVSIELEDITFEESVKVELFSGETLLTTATLNENALEANKNYDYVTCCIPTVGEDEAWSLTSWIPRDKIVPNKAVLFVDGHEQDTKTFTLDADEWAALPGTAFPYSGSSGGGYTYYTIKKATPKLNTYDHFAYVQGYPDGSFRPRANITRAEFAAMAVRFFDVEYDGPDMFSDTTGHWASDLINKAASAGIILGFKDGTFRPDQDITRAEAIAIFNRVLGRAPDKDHLLPDMITWPDNMDTDAWYYANMQEATNSHAFQYKTGNYETWTGMNKKNDWTRYEN